MNKPNTNITDMFGKGKLVKICAPMVRYSKLQFRNLVKLYDCDIMYTPMILADSFCKSNKARNNEFTTNMFDTPVITQFAANTAHEFVGAANLASPYCDGVDLNCGCPQRWASEMDLGCSMLLKPEIIYDLIRQCRNTISKPFSISVKMRLLNDVAENIQICQQLEKCGISFITVHGRTPSQSHGNINTAALKEIKISLQVPFVGNGAVSSLNECFQLQDEVGCDGVMVANAVLNNPGLFKGYSITPLECIQNWVDICYNSIFDVVSYEQEYLGPNYLIPERPPNLTFQCFHHHLVFMLDKIITRKQKRFFNNMKKFSEVLAFLKEVFNIVPNLFPHDKFTQFVAGNLVFPEKNLYEELKPRDVGSDDSDYFIYNYEDGNGKFYESKTSDLCSDLSNIFLEND